MRNKKMAQPKKGCAIFFIDNIFFYSVLLTTAFSIAILALLFPSMLFCGNSATLFG